MFKVVYSPNDMSEGYKAIQLIDKDMDKERQKGILYFPAPYLRSSLYMAAVVVVADGDMSKINELVKETLFSLYPGLRELSSEDQGKLFTQPWNSVILPKIQPLLKEINKYRKMLAETEKAA